MWHHNADLLAYHDLDGRSGLKLALQEAGGRFFPYVAGFWHSGWSILGVTNPEHPELLRWLDGPPNTMTMQVQVADGTVITGLEHPPPGLTTADPTATPQDGFLIWDVREPDQPQLLGEWVSGGTGTHRNFYHCAQWVYGHQQPARLRGPDPGHRRHRRPSQPQDGRHLVAPGAEQGGRRGLHPSGSAAAVRRAPLPLALTALLGLLSTGAVRNGAGPSG